MDYTGCPIRQYRPTPMIESISALTLVVSDMDRSTAFYQALGFRLLNRADRGRFVSLSAGSQFLNLAQGTPPVDGLWGRAIFYVTDVDRFHQQALDQGLQPDFAPEDAPWGERYFHITDPDGHELSFARPLPSGRPSASPSRHH